MTACTRPGCTGTIEDGYCDVCGLAAAPQATHAGAPQPAVGAQASHAAAQQPAAAAPPATATVSVPVSRGTRGSGSSRGRRAGGHLGARPGEIPPVQAPDPTRGVLQHP